MQRVRSKSPEYARWNIILQSPDTESEIPLNQPGVPRLPPAASHHLPAPAHLTGSRLYGGSAELCGVELNGDDPARYL